MTTVLNERTQWLLQRRSGIGGSDAAAILGLSPWQSALSLYVDKLGIGDPELDEPEWMTWGKILEPIIAEKYAKETGRTVVDLGPYTIQRSEQYPFMLCTIDREIQDATKGTGILEVKTAGAFKKEEWADEPPVLYQIQLQHSLIVMDRKWGSFAVLIGGQRFMWMDVERNDRFCEYLISEERKFWDKVQRMEPPAPDASQASSEALARLYPRDTGVTISLDGRFIELAAELDERKATEKATKDRIRAIENELKAAIGDASLAVLPDNTQFSYKNVTRAAYTVAATEYRQLRRIKAKGN